MSVTFTKLFSSITESTVWCEPTHTRIAWITMLAMADRHGRVWASVPGLANRARITVDEAREAIACFLSPDPDSRTKTHDGRRIAEIDGGWMLINYAKYRAIIDDEDRKKYKAEWIKDKRRQSVDKCRQSVDSDNQCRYASTQAEAEAEADTKKKDIVATSSLRRASRFVRPSIEEIAEYCTERKNSVDPQLFFDHYESNGWLVGKNLMKNWRASIRTWERMEKPKHNGGSGATKIRTDEDWMAEGKRLGIAAKPGESWPSYQGRIRAGVACGGAV